MLWSCGVELLVALLMVGLLEEDICTYACFLELAVVFNCSCCDIYIYTADSSVLVLDGIDSLDTFKDILDRIVYRILARFDSKALVSHILKSNDLLTDLFLSQLLTRNFLVLHMIWTVYALVYAII